MQYEAFWRGLLKNKFKERHFQVDTESEVGKLPLQVDLIVKIEKQPTHYTGELNTLIQSFKRFNVFELKSPGDKLNVHDFFRLQACAMLLLSTESRSINELNEIELFYILSNPVPMLLKEAKEIGVLKRITSGIYRLNRPSSGYFVLVNELPVDPEWYPLLLFSVKNKRKEFLKRIFHEKDNFYIPRSLILFPEVVNQMAESEEIEIPIEFDPRKGLELMIDLIGFKRVVEEFGLQRVVEEFGLQRVVEEFGLQRVVEEFGLQRVVEELSENQKEELKKLLIK